MPIIDLSSLSFTSLFLLTLLTTNSHAFSVTRRTSSSFSLLGKTTYVLSRSPSQLGVYFDNKDGGYHDDEDDFFDLEKARERFEALMGEEDNFQPFEEFQQQQHQQQHEMQTVGQQDDQLTPPTPIRSPSYNTQDDGESTTPLPALDVVLPPAPPLTTIERERRQVEIQLLDKLRHGDDAVSDLWTLWFSERGSAAATKLVRADELTNQGPAYWEEAESILQELVTEHGVYWVEPVNRLATLYYMQGQLDKAETLCKIVLAVKPWHFGALSGIVMIYAANTDSEKARLWAASRLPTFAPTGANRRRVAWTDKAVQSATQSLENAEERIQQLFGEPDDYYTSKGQSDNNNNNDNSAWEEDAWQ